MPTRLLATRGVLQDLIEELKSEIGGNFGKLIMAMMMPPADFDAQCLRGVGEITAERSLHTVE